VSYQPSFTVSHRLVRQLEAIAALREQILAATVQVTWIPALQKDSRVRNAHSSTAIEGNPLTLEQVRAIEEGKELPAVVDRAKREILNYFAALRFIEKNLKRSPLRHDDLFELHEAMAGGGVMDQGTAGRYRTINVRIGNHFPPTPAEVSGLMFELLEWWNNEAPKLSPVLSSGVLHYRFEEIHPFADGNGRTGRALALWELYRRGFDTHYIFSVDEFYWDDRPRYYAALDAVPKQGGDLTGWLEYVAEGMYATLDNTWTRIQHFAAGSGKRKVVLRPKQEQVLQMLRDRKSMAPQEIWDALGITKQGALKLLNPLLEAGMIRRIGTRKSGRYILP
jgi:Fic family protein